MVDTVAADVSRLFGIYCLLDMGGVSGRALFVRAVPFADVLTADMGSRRPAADSSCMARRLARMAASLDIGATDNTCDLDPMGAGRISVYLLLLSRRVL